jgi:hypothetical protein
VNQRPKEFQVPNNSFEKKEQNAFDFPNLIKMWWIIRRGGGTRKLTTSFEVFSRRSSLSISLYISLCFLFLSSKPRKTSLCTQPLSTTALLTSHSSLSFAQHSPTHTILFYYYLHTISCVVRPLGSRRNAEKNRKEQNKAGTKEKDKRSGQSRSQTPLFSYLACSVRETLDLIFLRETLTLGRRWLWETGIYWSALES